MFYGYNEMYVKLFMSLFLFANADFMLTASLILTWIFVFVKIYNISDRSFELFIYSLIS